MGFYSKDAITCSEGETRLPHCYTWPTDTTEGNPLLQRAASEGQIANLRHVLTALVLSVTVAVAFWFNPEAAQPLNFEYVMELFFMVGRPPLVFPARVSGQPLGIYP